MNYTFTLIEQIFIMFLLLFIGFFLYKIKMVSTETNQQLTKIVLNLVNPAVVLSAYQVAYDPEQAKNMLYGFLLSAISMGIAILVSQCCKIKGKKGCVPTEQFAVVFTNCGFIGLPLLFALFGKLGVFYCNTYVTVFNLMIWTYGITLMSRGAKETRKISVKDQLKQLLTPTMVCIGIGLVLYFARIRLPHPVHMTVDYIASMNTPLAMLVSGVYIAQSDLLGALKNLRIYYLMVLKCFVVPLLVLLVFSFLPMNQLLKTSILLLAACPTGANTMLFAAGYHGNVERASNIFTLTTLCSILSLPIIIMLTQY